MIQNDAIVVLLAGADSELDRFTLVSGQDRTTGVAIPDPFVPLPRETGAVDAAVERIEAGAEMIERYRDRGIGPVTAGRAIRAVHGRAPAGSARYGGQ